MRSGDVNDRTLYEGIAKKVLSLNNCLEVMTILYLSDLSNEIFFKSFISELNYDVFVWFLSNAFGKIKLKHVIIHRE